MKATITFDFINIRYLEEAIERIEELVKQHVEAKGCRFEDPLLNCPDLTDLWWMYHNFVELKEKAEKLQEMVDNTTIDSHNKEVTE